MSLDIIRCFFCGSMITEPRGRTAFALCAHHLCYVPEIKVKSHVNCHHSYHNNTENTPIRPENLIKINLPVPCYFCDELITEKGMNSLSLVTHSLDGNHTNWDPSNKVPVHKKCHNKIHFGGTKHSGETKQRMSEIAGDGRNVGENNPMYGRRHTEETKLRMSNSNKGKNTGKKHSDEFKRQRSEAWMGDKNPMRRPEVADKIRGDKNPAKRPEVRAKISNALTGRKLSEEHKEKISKYMMGRYVGDKNPSKRPEVREKISDALKKSWARRKQAFSLHQRGT